jgi:hypothetical protein
MELPSHPQSDDAARGQEPRRPVSWGTMIAIAVLAVVFATVVLLHLTGVVGPGGH